MFEIEFKATLLLVRPRHDCFSLFGPELKLYIGMKIKL